MSIDLKTISDLRDKTGAGIGDCKKALEEAGGDIEKAIEVLRKKGEIKAAKKSDRTAKEGVVSFAKGDKKLAAVVLACETDFVARNEDFINTAKSFAEKLLTISQEEFKSWAEATIKNELTMKVGENLLIADLGVSEGEVIGSYLHHNNKSGAVVVLEGGNEEIANEIALQVTAMMPKYLSPEFVPAEEIAKEKEIYQEQLKRENKPEAIWDKIIEGKLAKYYEDVCLLNQVYIKDDSKKIKDILEGAVIKEYRRYQI